MEEALIDQNSYGHISPAFAFLDHSLSEDTILEQAQYITTKNAQVTGHVQYTVGEIHELAFLVIFSTDA